MYGNLGGKSFGIIGAGRMGRAHIQAAQNLGLVCKFICEPNQENLAEAVEICDQNRVKLFKSVNELRANFTPVDLVIVATTTDVRTSIIQMLVDQPIQAILCEKPMASSVYECSLIIQLCQSAGIRLAVNHQMRFMDQYRIILDALKSGRYGELCSMTVVGGCFGLAMNGSHYIEAFNWLTNSTAKQVTAWFANTTLPNPRGPNFHDQAGEARLVSTGGQRLLLNCGADQGHGMTVTYATSFGHLFVDELNGYCNGVFRKEKYRALPPTRYGMPTENERMTFEIPDNVLPTSRVIHSLMVDSRYPDGLAGKAVVSALVAMWESVDKGSSPVALSDLGKKDRKQLPWA